jgi:hypothetical protein
MAKQLQTKRSFLRITIGGDSDPAVGDLNLQREEGAPTARSTGALSGVGLIRRAVSPAFQKPMVITEKLVRPPIEGRASVDTIVDVSVIPSIEIYHKRFDESPSPDDVKLYRFARCNIGNWRRPFLGVSRAERHVVSFDHDDEMRGEARVFALSKTTGANRRLRWLCRRTNTGSADTVRRISGRFH